MRSVVFLLLLSFLASVYALGNVQLPDSVIEEYKKKQKADEVFMAKQQADETVVKLPSGLMYKEIVAGTGKPPSSDDTVTIHYEGTLVNGKVFDSTHQRKKPQVLPVAKMPVPVRVCANKDSFFLSRKMD